MTTKTSYGKVVDLISFAIISLLSFSFPTYSMAQYKAFPKGELATCNITVSTVANIGIESRVTKRSPQARIAKPLNNKSKLKEIIKSYKLGLNQLGYFNQVSNIQPQQKVPIEITYPHGRTGENVLVTVADGGKLDNGKGVKVVPLNSQRKIAFSFQTASSQGIYRIFLRKGNDMKVVQLWVGKELPTTARLKTKLQSQN